MFLRPLLSIAFVITSATTTLTASFAGVLEDGLLAGSALNLDVKGVEQAIRRGAKVDQALPLPDSPNTKRTPIEYALRSLQMSTEELDAPQRAERILRALFKAGAKPSGDRDELFVAISGGHSGILSLLLDQGANPHSRIYGYTPAELAIKYGQAKLLPQLYKRNIPKVEPDVVAQIQFVHAASDQNGAAMQDAVRRGANVDAPDPAGAIAIVQFFSRPLLNPEGHESLKWLLLEAGANANAVELSEKQNTALHMLIRRNSARRSENVETAAIAEVLLRKGADVSAVDDIGRTPLHYAADVGNIPAMKILLHHGAKVMARDALRKTPLDLAKSGDAIALLREAGARE